MGRAQGRRIAWEDLPHEVQRAVEERLGSTVVRAETQQGGFSPGVAARLRTAAGARVFLKATHADLNVHSPNIHRREARIASALPAHAPVSHLLWVHDDAETGWVVLAFADIEGHLPAIPWKEAELERVVTAMAGMHAALTPSPLALPSAGDRIRKLLSGWARLRGDEDGLDPWSRRHLDTLIALEHAAPSAADGDTMLHEDLRADNMLLTETGVVFVDWPHACIGAPWVDMLGMAPSVALEGGPDPGEFFAMHPAARAADPHRVDAVLAAFAGYFTFNALEPHPPGLPTLRAFQAAQGEVARRWLAQRLGLR